MFPCYCASTGTQGAEERRGKLKHVEFYRTEMRGKSQAGIILRADGVGKMCKEDDANALLMVEITAAHPSLLPDEFIFKRTK